MISRKLIYKAVINLIHAAASLCYLSLIGNINIMTMCYVSIVCSYFCHLDAENVYLFFWKLIFGVPKERLLTH